MRPQIRATGRLVAALLPGMLAWHGIGAQVPEPAGGEPTITTTGVGDQARAQGGTMAGTAKAADGTTQAPRDMQSPDSVAYGATRERMRASGFGDLEIDLLHGRIARNLDGVLKIPGLPEKPPETDPKSYADFWELIATSDNRLLARGKDVHGDSYLRLTLREGSSYSTDIFPTNYVFRAHCYLYPNPETGELNRIIFQFYRVNYSGSSYNRELRRLIHPNPKDRAQAAGKLLTEKVELLDNSELNLEFYEAASSIKPVWEGSDGIPLPNPGGALEIKEMVYLNKKETPLDYDEQIRMIVRYKRLLREVDRLLYARLRSFELNREVILERLLDFPS